MNSDTKRQIGKQKMQEAVSYYLDKFGYDSTIELCQSVIARLEALKLTRENLDDENGLD